MSYPVYISFNKNTNRKNIFLHIYLLHIFVSGSGFSQLVVLVVFGAMDQAFACFMHVGPPLNSLKQELVRNNCKFSRDYAF